MAEEANPELESFRKQWQEEVIARSKGPSSINRPDKTLGQPRREGEVVQPRPRRGPSDRIESVQKEERSLDGLEGEGYHDLEDKDIRRQLGQEGEGIHPSNDPKHEPTSALEHYEQAVERESQGKLGDSVKLYRKAFRVCVPGS